MRSLFFLTPSLVLSPMGRLSPSLDRCTSATRGISLAMWAPLRLFHPPLMIPSRAVRSCTPKAFLWHRGLTVALGDGDGFWVSGGAAEAIGTTWDGTRAGGA